MYVYPTISYLIAGQISGSVSGGMIQSRFSWAGTVFFTIARASTCVEGTGSV